MRRSILLASTAIAILAPPRLRQPRPSPTTYDARGRLVQVARSGTVNNGVTTSYTIDKTGKRTNKSTTGSAISRT